MIEPEEWRQRLEAAVAETLRRRAARQAGLAARHRNKLGRGRYAAPHTPVSEASEVSYPQLTSDPGSDTEES